MEVSISETIVPFKHDALPDAAKYIRLLKVLGDEYSEDIKVRCRITTWLVDNKPSYNAISYTWGAPEPMSTILVNGQAFRVRTNCEFVLKQAYWYEKTSYYWVDAICIDQESLEEKSMQVSIMGNIYKQAARVLACVGDHADDSAFLAHKLNQHAFSKRPFAIRLRKSYADFRFSFTFQLGHRSSTTVRFLRAVFRFLKRPYFTRLWILQELRNAQEAIFLCGSDTVPRSFIGEMSERIHHKLGEDTSASVAKSISRRLPIFRRLCPLEEFRIDKWTYSDDSTYDESLRETIFRALLVVKNSAGVVRLLIAADMLECQERKDKIFGVISLIDWGVSGQLVPDYTQTEFEVAVSFFKALLPAQYQDGGSHSWEMSSIGAFVVVLLKLDHNSAGVPSAVGARRIEPGTCLPKEETNFERIHSQHPNLTGWRVSSGHLTKSDPGFSTWSQPGSNKCKVYLPCWVQDGDWIVATEAYFATRFVLVREVAEGLGGPLIGHAVSSGLSTTETSSTNFTICWDPEDFVTFCILENEIKIRGFETGQYSPESVRALNTAICRERTPGSSYALRYD